MRFFGQIESEYRLSCQVTDIEEAKFPELDDDTSRACVLACIVGGLGRRDAGGVAFAGAGKRRRDGLGCRAHDGGFDILQRQSIARFRLDVRTLSSGGDVGIEAPIMPAFFSAAATVP